MLPFQQDGLWRVTALVRRRAGIDEAHFTDRLVQSLAPATAGVIGGDARLVVDRRPAALDPAVGGLSPPLFDGLLGLWFEDEALVAPVMNRLGEDATVRRIAGDIIDPAGGALWLAEVFPIKPEEGASRIKFLAAGDAAEGWSIADAQRYWRDVHPVVARTAPMVWEPLTRYVQFHGRPAPEGVDRDPWLGVWKLVPLCAEMGFAREQDFILNYSNEQFRTIIRPDEEKFSRPGEMLAFVSDQERELVPHD
ncbi:MAG: hypothetical protein JWO65_3 [Sphingomonas bacterium]|nr:hypothetical protein [Sphingomonas bacterium]